MPGKLEAPERRGVYLLTHPRSASNLFQTMMAKQPGYQNSGYKLFEAGFATLGQLQRGPLSEWPEEDRKALYDKFVAGWESLQDEVEDANKKNLQAFIKEHTLFLSGPDKQFDPHYPHDTPNIPFLDIHERHAAPNASPHTNPTSLPDTFLLTLQPIFQIRHPALMFPSMFRVLRKGIVPADASITHPLMSSVLTLRHSRLLYDWYLSHTSSSPTLQPIIIDADDIMNNPDAVAALCDQTGLSKEDVQYEWEKREEGDPIKKEFLSTINASKGIVAGKDSKGLDVEKEKEKWVGEFGEEDARGMGEAVERAMGDYGYLWGRRVRGD